jgi:hypothetical protein
MYIVLLSRKASLAAQVKFFWPRNVIFYITFVSSNLIKINKFLTYVGFEFLTIFHLSQCNTIQSGECHAALWRNMLLPSSGSTCKSSKKPTSCCLLHSDFSLLGVFLNPEDGGNMFLSGAGWLSLDYMELYARR